MAEERTFNYPRHFALLGIAAVAIWYSGELRLSFLSSDARALFVLGLPGAAHALALVCSLKTRPALWRCGTVVLGAMVVASIAPIPTAMLGAAIVGTISSSPESPFWLSVFIVPSAIGALAYWLLIKYIIPIPLRASSLAWTTASCSPATLLGVWTGVASANSLESRSASWVALAMPWWLAFSGSMYFSESDTRKYRFAT